MRKGSRQPGGAPESALARVLAREAELEAQLSAAAARADGLRQTARDQAAARLAVLDSELLAAAVELERRLVAEGHRRLAGHQEHARVQAERFAAATAHEAGTLAEWIVHEVMAPAGGAAP